MERWELEAYLGDAAATTTEEQVDELLRLAGVIEEIYPDPDGDGSAIFAGAVKLVLGDANLEALASVLAKARQRERDAMADLAGAVIASVGRGVSEAEAARRAGVSRITVRAMVGKGVAS